VIRTSQTIELANRLVGGLQVLAGCERRGSGVIGECTGRPNLNMSLASFKGEEAMA